MRRLHRWLGITAAVFVILLSATGIALNHGDAWRLDQRFVAWDWLLDAYGIAAPDAARSFEADGRRVTLIGNHVYFDARELATGEDWLAGYARQAESGVIGLRHAVLVVTAEGELIERLDTTDLLPGGILRVGRLGARAAIGGAEGDFIADDLLTGFEQAPAGADASWSRASPLPTPLRTALNAHYRGRGLTVERLLTDLHSGRIGGTSGVRLMDVVGVFLIALSATGLLLWIRRR